MGAEAGSHRRAPVAYRWAPASSPPACKPGKLPQQAYAARDYALEYGTTELQMHKDAVTADDRVLIVETCRHGGNVAIPPLFSGGTINCCWLSPVSSSSSRNLAR